MPTIDDIARVSKDNLRSSLMVTRNLTLGSTAPCDALLQRMNDVLRDVVDSNFDCNLNSVGALYAAIGDKQPQMMDNSSNLALVNFSRTFAVVLEEAILRAGGGRRDGNNNNNQWRTNNNNNNEWRTNNNNNTEWRSNNNGGGGGGQVSWQMPAAGSGAPVRASAYGRPPSLMGLQEGGGWGGASASATASNAFKGFGPSQQQHATTAAAASSVKFCGFGGGPAASATDEAKAAAAIARAERFSQKDYSDAAIMGRITVFNVPTCVDENELREYLAQVGPIHSFSYPYGSDARHKGFALVKYMDNETADAAVAQLHGKKLEGAALVVERAKYWFRKDDKDDTQRGSVAAEQPIRKQSEEEFYVNAPESASVGSSASDDDDDSDDGSDEEDSRNGESDTDC